MADDLSKFRQNWLKELCQHRNQDQKEGTSADNSPRPPDDYAGPPSLRDCGANNDYEPVLPQQDQFVDNAGIDNRLQVVQEQICDSQAESSATYYPFRILTTLLNRASTEVGPKRKRKRTSSGTLSDEKTVTPKKTYFSATDDCELEKDRTQNLKTEDVKCKQRKEEKDRKDYLDLFIADLVSKSECFSCSSFPLVPSLSLGSCTIQS